VGQITLKPKNGNGVFFFFERAVHPFWGKAHTRTNQGSEVRDGAVVGLSQQLTYI
jgi:hypothetical protein